MFKAATGSSVRRMLYRAAGGGPYKKFLPTRTGLLASSAVLASVLLYSQRTVYSDALDEKPETPQWSSDGASLKHNKSDTLNTLVWGSNRAGIIDPLLPTGYSVRQIFAPVWLNDVAMRDLALHERHAACVDARGDVYQWGEGYNTSRTPDADGRPTRTLSGKNIVKLQLTPTRVFALSKSGRIYILAANAANQELAPRSSAWWNFWTSPQKVDFVELTPNDVFGWGEKFTSISAGQDHLLALTSSGRTYSCPINENGNARGQLGFNAPNLSSPYNIPKSIASPSFTAAVTSRQPPVPEIETKINDDSGIRFCTTLHEIPVLKGIQFAQVTAGARSSFARTPSGKVLAWGANEHGQLGLGAKDPSEPVTVPTEVVLWPRKNQQASTRCLDVSAGGNLTGFTIERAPADEAKTVELLMTGDGQWGGLGNNTYSNVQISPVRVKALSGLTEYNDATQRLQFIPPRAISISPSGHVFATLDPSSGRRDLHAWGRNQDYELGPGARKPGTCSPMPVGGDGGGRVLLQSKKSREVKDLQGRVWGRGIKVEQVAVAGFGTAMIYWKL
ncbi:regulator of chromosome condensation 1/beta-lactamase-inhibitor protein II [Mycena albidolilacea]|uniref:Regulator of chromosome condensation 1/beta-lactamase-inhibitor protein II n=1 Tax=Mycena albidolilacea TaxID=1033008 RepID=A0AAD6ZXQ0_9AGAR|nr:regulator of chromosome condensation 1/beta-lactamase-inhibitor protein II [Mycena albidolilacea]